MTAAKVSRIHSPSYSPKDFPPMPPRIRLAANCWERVWWLTLHQDLKEPQELTGFLDQFVTDSVKIRAQMRTRRRLCFAVTTTGLDENSEFEIAMTIMAYLERNLGAIERVEDRPATMWPYEEFAL
ncbi:hypothetical protein QWZ13_13485 [Reinekea marina]|uniref:Uncharacterized protein n=1 Tax=Reinekea marina TaxID=1310421 RepID=A0ABV7WNC7_9GAMM|nr:hypothetical protein [Reinekea marina]MDN3649927.1 hypothetical protein [Reinekea marina]